MVYFFNTISIYLTEPGIVKYGIVFLILANTKIVLILGTNIIEMHELLLLLYRNT